MPSLPVRGAWIEISSNTICSDTGIRRSPCGERGLKLRQISRRLNPAAVAPRAGSVD